MLQNHVVQWNQLFGWIRLNRQFEREAFWFCWAAALRASRDFLQSVCTHSSILLFTAHGETLTPPDLCWPQSGAPRHSWHRADSCASARCSFQTEPPDPLGIFSGGTRSQKVLDYAAWAHGGSLSRCVSGQVHRGFNHLVSPKQTVLTADRDKEKSRSRTRNEPASKHFNWIIIRFIVFIDMHLYNK